MIRYRPDFVAARRAVMATALVFSISACAVAQSSSTRRASDDDNIAPYSIGVFGGGQWWRSYDAKGAARLAPGGAVGFRADQDFRRYFGVEEQYTFYAVNNLRLRPSPGGIPPITDLSFDARNAQFMIGPVLYLTPNTSRFRPFVTVGPALQYFWTTQNAKADARSGLAFRNTTTLKGDFGPSLVFGGGLKYALAKHLAIRADARGTWTEQPHFGLDTVSRGPGTVFIPKKGTILGLQTTLGFDIRWGYHEAPAAVPTPTPTPTPTPSVQPINVTVAADKSEVCPGETVRVTATTNLPSGSTPTYQWTVNGEQLSTADVLQFGTTGREAGRYTVGVTVNAAGFDPGTGNTVITVSAYGAPTGTVTANPSEVEAGGKSTLTSNFTNKCAGAISGVTYTASEGTVTGDQFDSTGVRFDPSNTGDQRKPVTITATATDDHGTGTATTTVTVHKKANPNPTRLPDVVFARNNARVNNCGKHVLLEELKANLDRDPGGRVVFVGHTDRGEPKALGERRALNAAAIISAGSGICLNFAPGQILISNAGSEPGGADPQPYFCGTSATPKSTERSGQAVSANDKRAEYRRVEVWFVPSGGQLPPSAVDPKDATSLNVGKLGCPK
jgi:outer membrane protein OmpA-like peptidoglycan-associated protein